MPNWIKEQLLGGYAELGQNLGSAIEFTDPDWLGKALGYSNAEELAQSVKQHWGQVAEANPPMGGNLYDDPSLLLDPKWLAGNTLRMIPFTMSTLPFGVAGGAAMRGFGATGRVAGGVGGALPGSFLEAQEVYQRAKEKGLEDPEGRTLAATAGIAALNLAPTSAILSNLPFMRKGVATAVSEGITEYLEEPMQAALMDEPVVEALKQGLNVIPPAMLLGGATAAAGHKLGQNQPLDEAEMARRVLSLHEQNGGATVTLNGTDMAKVGGFAVGAYPARTRVVRDRPVTVGDIRLFKRENNDLLQEYGNAVGTWTDTETGETFLDVAKVFPDRAKAESLGRQLGERAIFDLGNMDEIRLAYSSDEAMQLPLFSKSLSLPGMNQAKVRQPVVTGSGPDLTVSEGRSNVQMQVQGSTATLHGVNIPSDERRADVPDRLVTAAIENAMERGATRLRVSKKAIGNEGVMATLQRLTDYGYLDSPKQVPGGMSAKIIRSPTEHDPERMQAARERIAYSGDFGDRPAWRYTSRPENVFDGYRRQLDPLFNFPRTTEFTRDPDGSELFIEYKPLTQKQSGWVAAALQDLERNGMPVLRLGINKIGLAHYANERINGNYNAETQTLYLNEEMVDALVNQHDATTDNAMRVFLAHEISHHIDINPDPAMQNDNVGASMAANSPLFHIDKNGQHGSIMSEVMYAYFHGTNEHLVNFLNYPLGSLEFLHELRALEAKGAMMGMSQDELLQVREAVKFQKQLIQAETFAQLSALYWVFPETTAKHMPMAYEFMRRIEDGLHQPTAPARAEHLQTVFQTELSPVQVGAVQPRLFARGAGPGAQGGPAGAGAGTPARTGQRGRGTAAAATAGSDQRGSAPAVSGGVGRNIFMYDPGTINRMNDERAADELVQYLGSEEDIENLNMRKLEEWDERFDVYVEQNPEDMILNELDGEVVLETDAEREALSYLSSNEGDFEAAINDVQNDIDEDNATEPDALKVLNDWQAKGYKFYPEDAVYELRVTDNEDGEIVFAVEGEEAEQWFEDHDDAMYRGEVDEGEVRRQLADEGEIEPPEWFDKDEVEDAYERAAQEVLGPDWTFDEAYDGMAFWQNESIDARVIHTARGAAAEVFDEVDEDYITVYDGSSLANAAEDAVYEYNRIQEENHRRYKAFPRPDETTRRAIRHAAQLMPVYRRLEHFERLDPLTIQIAAALPGEGELLGVGPLTEEQQAALWMMTETEWLIGRFKVVENPTKEGEFVLLDDDAKVWASEREDAEEFMELVGVLDFVYRKGVPERYSPAKPGMNLNPDTWEEAKKVIKALSSDRPTYENAEKVRNLIRKFYPNDGTFDARKRELDEKIKKISRGKPSYEKAMEIREFMEQILGPSTGLESIFKPLTPQDLVRMEQNRNTAMRGYQKELREAFEENMREQSIFTPKTTGMKGEGERTLIEQVRQDIQELTANPSYENAEKVRRLLKALPQGTSFIPSMNTTERVHKYRRKVQPWTRETARNYDRSEITTALEVLAEQLGTSPEQVQKFLKRKLGDAYNSEQIQNAADIVVQEASNINRDFEALMEKLEAGTITDQDIARLYELELQTGELLAQYMGVRAEAGRALNAFRKVKSVTERVQRVLEHKSRDQMLAELRLMRDMEGGERIQFAGKLHEITRWHQLLEYYINSLISGPQTHAVNFLSNSLMELFEGAARLIAAATSKEVSFKEAWQYSSIFWANFPKAVVKSSRYIVNEDAVATIMQGVEREMAGKIEAETGRRKAIPGLVGKIIRTPGRALGAMDMAFKVAVTRADLMARTTRAGIPLEEATEEMIEASWKTAEKMTFTENLGEWGQAASRLANLHPLFRGIIAPFIRTPWNIAKFAVQQGTPLGLLAQEYKMASPAEQAIMRGRMLLGSGLAITAFLLAQAGLVSGAPPEDPREREHWYRFNQPYSIKVGDKWVSFSRFEPLGMLMGAAGDFGVLSGKMSEMEAGEIVNNVMASMYRNLASKTFLRGFFDAIKAMDDPVRYGETYLQRQSSGIVPTALAQMARVEDPYLRRVDSIMDALRARIPGQREQLMKRLDVYGRPIKLEGGLGPDILSPAYMRTIEPDPVVDELMQHDYFPGRPSAYFRRGGISVDLNPMEHQQLITALGKPLYGVLSVLINSPGYRGLDPWSRREVLQTITERVRSAGRQYWLGNNPQVVLRWLQEAIAERRRFNAA